MDKPREASQPGFDDPLALLRADHTRILDHCDLLEQLVTGLETPEDKPQPRDTARKVSRYFSHSGRLHHRDEETDLFRCWTLRSWRVLGTCRSAADRSHRCKWYEILSEHPYVVV